ncbi:MAG: hypothetical protein PHS93_09310 [Candidatus Omnitrophica bacterium]|nr:hypothetical protein [Candidatus Omnitrophota bacterium]MDD5551505.1 hypothetical protein [Candidatus Omnitrophota bacterium]
MAKWNGLNRNKKPRQISLKRLKKLKHDKSSWNGLKRNNKPRMISKKKIATIYKEKLIRSKVKIRANGKCEICKLIPCPPSYKLSIHELIFRSAGKHAGGVVSLGNSWYTCDICHDILQHYRILQKGQCIRMIIQVRNVDLNKANEIYQRVYNFAEQHGLIRESKVGDNDTTSR